MLYGVNAMIEGVSCVWCYGVRGKRNDILVYEELCDSVTNSVNEWCTIFHWLKPKFILFKFFGL